MFLQTQNKGDNMDKIVNFLAFQNPDFEKIPDISLYMDQLLDYLEQNLQSTKRHESDAIFTKTMINNYVKAGLLDAPIKKKYEKSTLIDLIAFYHLKQVFSIQDAHAILNQFKTTISPEIYYPQFVETYENIKSTTLPQSVENLSIEEATTLMIHLGIESSLKKALCEQLLDFIQQKNMDNVDK